MFLVFVVITVILLCCFIVVYHCGSLFGFVFVVWFWLSVQCFLVGLTYDTWVVLGRKKNVMQDKDTNSQQVFIALSSISWFLISLIQYVKKKKLHVNYALKIYAC